MLCHERSRTENKVGNTVVLVSFDAKLTLSWRISSIRCLWAGLWGVFLIADWCLGPSTHRPSCPRPQAGEPGVYVRQLTGRGGHKPTSHIPLPFLLQAPALASFPGFQQWWTIAWKPNKLFSSSSCLCLWCLSQQQKTRQDIHVHYRKDKLEQLLRRQT